MKEKIQKTKYNKIKNSIFNFKDTIFLQFYF